MDNQLVWQSGPSLYQVARDNAGVMSEAGLRGLEVGGKASVNSLAHTVVSTATIGFVDGAEAKKDASGRVVRPFGWNVWEVTEEDLVDGYMSSYMFGRGGWELLAAAGTGSAAMGMNGAGRTARAARLLMWTDTAKNVVTGTKGAVDIYENGLNWQNGLQTFGGFLGARSNLKMMNGAGMGGRANRLLNAADEFLINNRTTRALGSGAGWAIGAAPRGVDKLWELSTGRRLIGGTLHRVFDGTRYQNAMQRTADWLRLKACFGAGTKLLAKGEWGEGWRAIELITTNDFVASRDEHRPIGPIEWKAVEELFQRTAPVMSLSVNGQVVRTTAEHPFYHEEKGWTPAGELEVGDRLVGQYGELVFVNKVEAGGEFEAVYNLRVAEYHTYFVGDDGWGFGVWAHNAECTVRLAGDKKYADGFEAIFGKSEASRKTAVTPLLTNEGKVGTFGYLSRKVGKPGDNLTPHHVPSDSFMNAKVPGYTRSDGISILMEQPSVGGRHRQTLSYSRSPDLSRTPRQALAEEVADTRRIYMEQGHYTPAIRSYLLELIRQNRAAWPGVF